VLHKNQPTCLQQHKLGENKLEKVYIIGINRRNLLTDLNLMCRIVRWDNLYDLYFIGGYVTVFLQYRMTSKVKGARGSVVG
jgi:hypothetical protein